MPQYMSQLICRDYMTNDMDISPFQGFYHHVKKEHNMWSYIFYFLYLSDTNPNDLSALDSYVADLVINDFA